MKHSTRSLPASVTRTTAAINGDLVLPRDFSPHLRTLLTGKQRPEDRVVIVKSKPDTPYDFWILITGLVEEAGGTVTIQREEERQVQVPD